MGGRVAKAAELLLGDELMPWQRQVVDVGLEIDPRTGHFAYREIIVSVMRQNGKTTLVLANEVERCTVWPEPQRCVYTAQTGKDSKHKLLNEHVPVILDSPLGKLITPPVGKIRRAADDTGVDFGGPNGGTIDALTSATASGHGRVVDLGVLDEAWKDADDDREQAVLPAMATRPWGQLWVVSTKGTESSTYLNRKIKMGRAFAVEDPGSEVAYFEWSIPEDENIYDPKVWWRYMPALGWTITEAAVAHAARTMKEDEFRRAFGNQQQQGGTEREIPAELWDRCQDPQAAPEGKVVFSVEVGPEREYAAIVASDGRAVEVVEHREGASWVPGWFAEKSHRRSRPVVIDKRGPAQSLVKELRKKRVKVTELATDEVVAACGVMQDAIADARVAVRPSSQALDDAVAVVRKRPVGDRFVWSRSTSEGDITTFFAATLAFAAAQSAGSVYEDRGLQVI